MNCKKALDRNTEYQKTQRNIKMKEFWSNTRNQKKNIFFFDCPLVVVVFVDDDEFFSTIFLDFLFFAFFFYLCAPGVESVDVNIQHSYLY